MADKTEQADIMATLKRLQAGEVIENLNGEEEEEDGDYSWEYETESEDEAAKPNANKAKVEEKEKEKEESDWEYEDEEEAEAEEEEDLSGLEDMELLDPFSAAPAPVIPMKVVEPKTNGTTNGTNGVNGTDGEKKKHRKHHKKSKHQDKFEKFRRLEKKAEKGEDEGGRSKKIHVRSKDPSAIARQFEKGDKNSSRKAGPKPPAITVEKICKICGKEPYVVERITAEKRWWHKNCFRCQDCNKILNLDTYKSHEGVIYCIPHHRDLFKPKTVVRDVIGEIKERKEMQKEMELSTAEALEKHHHQQSRHETIIRESKPDKLAPHVVKGASDDSKWEGLESLDVGSKFAMFEKSSTPEASVPSDRYGIMEKLKRLQAGEDVEELLAEIDDELPSDEDEDPDDAGLTAVQKKAHHTEKLFTEENRREKLAATKKAELKQLREKLMAGTIDNIHDCFDEERNRKIKKTQVDVRSATAKKFMTMFDEGKVPEGPGGTSDKMTREKELELEAMRSKKRGESDYWKKMEKGELEDTKKKEPKLLVGRLKDDATINGDEENNGELEPEHATLSKKFSFFEKYEENQERKVSDTGTGNLESSERSHAARECKASKVLNKFKDMEKRAANGEPLDDEVNRRPLKRFTPPRKLGEESGSEYSDSDSDYSYSDSYSSSVSDSEDEEDEYIKNIREAKRAKALRAQFEEWESGLGEDGGYTNLVDEDGKPLETASKLRNRFENLQTEEQVVTSRPKFQVKRFKPKEAYEHQQVND